MLPVCVISFNGKKNNKKLSYRIEAAHCLVLLSILWQSRKTLHAWKDNSMLAKPLAACTHLSSVVSELYNA